MDDIYKDIEQYNQNKKRKILIVFYTIADMLSNKKFNPIGRKLNISLILLYNFIFL